MHVFVWRTALHPGRSTKRGKEESMSTLANFPMVLQLTTVTGDGRPSENAQYDCVAASIDAACRFLLGTPENSIFNPDHFKDEAYGEAWRNSGTAAISYVEFCKSLGVHLYPVSGNPGHLVDLVHTFLAEGKPVIFTEPDPYVSSTLGWTHVCVFYQDGPDYLVAMDPYIARPVHRTDQEWINLLQDNEIWIAERLEDTVKITINTPGVGNYFALQPNGWWLSTHTKTSSGQPIYLHGAIQAFYQVVGNADLCGLTDLGLPVSNEIPLDAKGNTRQHFECGVVFFDPNHLYDRRPGSTSRVYKAHLYVGPGQDPDIALLETEIAQLKQSVTGVDPAKVANRLQSLELLAKQIEQGAVAPL
jgi:hypothetical protein